MADDEEERERLIETAAGVDDIEFQTISHGITYRLLLSVFACVIGSSFQFGYNVGVVNAPESAIESFLNQTEIWRTGSPMEGATITLLWSVIVAVWAVGGMIGGFMAGFLANRFGRKGTMLLANGLAIVGGFVMLLSFYVNVYELLIIGRFVTGIHSGISTGVAPLYLSEVAPLRLRGLIASLHQVAIVTAILVSQILGLEVILGNSTRWSILLGLVLVPSAIQLLLLPLCPESPRFLLIYKHKQEEATNALLWLRGGQVQKDEMAAMEKELEEKGKYSEKVSMCDLFRKSSLRQPLIISIIMQCSQQLSGINAVMFYSTSIFKDAGLSLSQAQYATLGTGVVNVVMTLVSAMLMDHAGRRVLHLAGLGGMFIFSVLITVSLVYQETATFMMYLAVVAVLGYIMSFGIGPGAIPWFIVVELFAEGPRGVATSIAVLVNWFSNFLVGLVFPSMERGLQGYTFIPFMVLLIFFWTYTYFFLPETKNRSIEEITAQFKKPSLDGAVALAGETISTRTDTFM